MVVYLVECHHSSRVAKDKDNSSEWGEGTICAQ